jgi:hypothetical protein
LSENILAMKKSLPIYLYGVVILLESIFLLFSENWTFETLKLTVGLPLVLGALTVIVTQLSYKNKPVAFLYHAMHAFTMLFYGFFVLLICNKLETLIFLNYFLFFFYAFSEIFFCFWLFNLGKKIFYIIVIIRLLIGLLIGIGVTVLMYDPDPNLAVEMEKFGLLYMLMGINLMLYDPIVKTMKLKETKPL